MVVSVAKQWSNDTASAEPYCISKRASDRQKERQTASIYPQILIHLGTCAIECPHATKFLVL